MLHFGARPPFSFEKFISMAGGLIPDDEMEILKSASIDGKYPRGAIQPTLKRWYDHDTGLRNELVRIRASRKRLDPSKYIREPGYTEPSIAHLAVTAYRNPSILEAERSLDQERWRALDEFSFGHYFDLDFLIIYALKLKLLLKWEGIQAADRSELIEEALRKT